MNRGKVNRVKLELDEKMIRRRNQMLTADLHTFPFITLISFLFDFHDTRLITARENDAIKEWMQYDHLPSEDNKNCDDSWWLS